MQRAFHELIRAAETAAASLAKGPVTTDVAPAKVRDALARYDFKTPVPLLELVMQVTQLLQRWNVHVTHPRYFGLFNPSVTTAGVVADALAAIYNPQLASWSHAPAAQEIERLTLRWVAATLGPFDFANFTSGGAEANLTAVLAALTRRFPAWGAKGARAARGATLYITSEAHHSFSKIAAMTGLGREAVRKVRVDRDARMDPADLERQLKRDRGAFLVVGTAGTTSSGAIDPLDAVADICQKRNIWFHADAAWGGAAAAVPRLRPHLAGIERADSVTCDAHKWFSVPMGAGMFFSRHGDTVRRTFEVGTPYMPGRPEGADNPFEVTAQWSRRFIGLKLFMTIAELGEAGMIEQIDRQARVGEILREKLQAAGWRVVNRTPLPLVCFTRPRLKAVPFLREMHRRQIAWMSSVRIAGGPPVIRACVTSFRTTAQDIDAVVEALGGIASA